ncbi:g11952 [Coccomyxa viridis]|uniref:G11952 protein n=1 Tax=Coccomyxa viridis TaxID=1274662 RepID=A0ABP1G959_9CHLO
MHNSPFLDLSSPMTPYEWFKFFVMIPMFLVRCCITVVCMPFVWCVVVVLTWGVKANQPMTGWRKACIRPFLKTWSGILLHIGFNYWPSIKGLENLSKAKECRAMLVFNHVSYVDGIILGAYFLPCGLAKASIADMPFFGTFCRACSFLFVERKGSGDASQTTQASRGNTTELIHERCEDLRFPILAISPEGTTKRSECLLTFSTGAFVGGRAVMPVLLHYRSRYNNNGWGRVQSSLWHFMRLQTQLINLVDVEVLPPYIPSEEERKDPRLYADNVRRLMGEKLGVPLVEQGLKQQQELKRRGCCVDWTGRHIIISGKRPAKS